ncbi:MAG: hypothetical protein ACJ8BW_30450 [Ktedonobacteraceae bacterium]
MHIKPSLCYTIQLNTRLLPMQQSVEQELLLLKQEATKTPIIIDVWGAGAKGKRMVIELRTG